MPNLWKIWKSNSILWNLTSPRQNFVHWKVMRYQHRDANFGNPVWLVNVFGKIYESLIDSCCTHALISCLMVKCCVKPVPRTHSKKCWFSLFSPLMSYLKWIPRGARHFLIFYKSKRVRTFFDAEISQKPGLSTM